MTATRIWQGVAGAGAIGALLLALATLRSPDAPDSGEALVGPVPVTISAPPPLPVPAPPALLPAVEQRSAAMPTVLDAPSVPGGAPPGKAGIWSVPAEFAPPE